MTARPGSGSFGGRFTPAERSWCGYTVKLGCGLVLLSGWDARRREVRERPRQGSVPMSEPTTIKVEDGGFVSMERGPGSGRRRGSGTGPWPSARLPGPAPCAATGIWFGESVRTGAAGVLGLFASGVSTCSSSPLPLPLPWFRALPRADSERRAGPKVESGGPPALPWAGERSDGGVLSSRATLARRSPFDTRP